MQNKTPNKMPPKKDTGVKPPERTKKDPSRDLDRDLDDSFPASDPSSVTQPKPKQ
jgi:hypothetical protein